MNILVTGSAGFIGFSLVSKLLKLGYNVIGIDNHSDYYSTQLKKDRVSINSEFINYTHFHCDLVNKNKLDDIVKNFSIKKIINLAAQPGVRYSLENPKSYIDSNVVGFANILEVCRENKVKDLIYASSSSVYGGNEKIPFSTSDQVDKPLNLYAASKKSNELMAYSYSNLYNFTTIGLRFFTVYGPWGRPDMAIFKFTKAIFEGKPIQVFNNGEHYRDFTYIDDVVDVLIKLIENKVPLNKKNMNQNSKYDSFVNSHIYNVGYGKPIKILDFISILEKVIGKIAERKNLPLQAGEILTTYADTKKIEEIFKIKPKINIEEGSSKFVDWYRSYFRV